MFQKKIIIGSILGFIASTVGLLAVFFPDLFNLQKEKITEVKMIVKTHEDTVKLQTLIDEIFEKKKITYLNIEFELKQEVHYPKQEIISNNFNGDVWRYLPNNEFYLYEFSDSYIAPIKYGDGGKRFPEIAVSRFPYESSSEEIEHTKMEVITHGSINSGLIYRFLNEDIGDWEQRYDEKNSALEIICMEGDCYSLNLLGYFIPANEEEKEMEGEISVREFIKVPDHIIKLKDY